MKKRRRKTAPPKRPNAPKAMVRRNPSAAANKKIAVLEHRLNEALEQQTAASEVLKVISGSAFSLQPVFDAIAEKAVRLCAAERAFIFRFDGEFLRAVAYYNVGPELREFVDRNPIVPGRYSITARAALERRTVHVPDVQADPDYAYAFRDVQPIRTILAVPMLKGDDLVGIVTIYRLEVKLFAEKQVALVETFAAHAVIAIENTRLLGELRESLQQQTATADVLKVISRSTFDLQTVLDTLTESAARLCDADMACIVRPERGHFIFAANYRFPQAFVDLVTAMPVAAGRGTLAGRVLAESRAVHIPDVEADPEYQFSAGQRAAGFRTGLGIPLLRQGTAIGVIVLTRKHALPFTDKQIELVTTFADQAVIAIENVRLFDAEQQRTRELAESLEQQTATSEVLRVISSSPGELEPVFDAMLENATRLCDASYGTLWLHEGDGHMRAAALHGDLSEAFLEKWGVGAVFRPSPTVPSARAMLSQEPVQLVDLMADRSYIDGDALAVAAAQVAGIRSIIAVPMIKDGVAVGAMTVYRREVRPFTDKQVALVANFAAQAVIAIENTRLLSELRESLQQQTATADVLKVISSSPGELEPVFQAMLENATRLCEASYGVMWLREGDGFRSAALHGPLPAAYVERWRSGTLVHAGPDAPMMRVAETRKPVQVPDMRESRAYLDGDPLPVAAVEIAGIRTLLSVPMFKEDELIGAITIYRKEVRAFSDKQVDLVGNFASQAVIAIENTRLLSELRQRTDDLSESLEQQTATSDVLRIVATSAQSVQPVFDAIVENAARLCEATFSAVAQFDGELLRLVAVNKMSPEETKAYHTVFPRRPNRTFIMGRAFVDGKPVHVEDIETDPDYDPHTLSVLKAAAPYRTYLGIPILRDGVPIGAIGCGRREVRPFTEAQIALVENFAAQAVIAIENARLLSELRQRTDDLTESLAQQTATSEVLKVISSSPGDLKPVFEAMIENAIRICEAQFGILHQYYDGAFHLAAMIGVSPVLAKALIDRGAYVPPEGIPLDRLLRTRSTVHIFDQNLEPVKPPSATLGGARSHLSVPLIKEGEILGAFTIYRTEVRPFSEKQIELVQNFAAQAVIAIENTRLLSELRESLERQTATADVLKVISRSAFDLKMVLDTLVESAARLCQAENVQIFLRDSEVYRLAAYNGFSPEYQEYVKQHPIMPGRGTLVARTALQVAPVHIPDVLTDSEYTWHEGQRLAGFRAMLGVPLLREGSCVGVMAMTRGTPQPFTDRQIELLTTFADQAVIAIENVRLFETEQQRTRELAKSLDDLRIAQDRLVQTQKLASLGQLTAGIAHEIKNPLNFVNNFSGVSVELIDELQEAVKHGSFDDKTLAEVADLTGTLRDNLGKIVQHGKRADSIVKNMLLHSREGSGERRPVDVNALVEESLNLAYHGARAETQGFNVTLERSFDPAAGEVDAFPQEITRVLLNLISNGFYAATKRQGQESGNGFEPTIRAVTKSLGDRVEIRIRDNGTGIPSEVRDKMFNPFFTTKPAGEGTGLGLSISHDIIVKQHSGSIEVDTEPGQFTEFRIILPRTTA
jgi:GAF domain-containing protein